MTTIAIVNAKGGVGKTTSSINLAAVAAYRGIAVHILDADSEQGTASDWAAYAAERSDADANLDIDVRPVNRAVLPRLIREFSDDIVIIDGPPGNQSMTELIVRLADFVLIPSQGTHADMEQTWKIIDVIDADTPFAVLPTRWDKRKNIGEQAKAALEGEGVPVIWPGVEERVFFERQFGKYPRNHYSELNGYPSVFDKILAELPGTNQAEKENQS